MEYTAKVTHIYTDGYVEVELEEDGRRAVARDFFRSKRGDMVLVEPEAGRGTDPITDLPYLSIIIMAVLGWAVGHGTGEKLLNALLLSFASFVISWLMTRKGRMRRRQEFQIVQRADKD